MVSGDGRKEGDRWQPNRDGPRAWGLFLYAFIGATATTAAIMQLRRSFDWLFSQMSRAQSWKSHGGFREEAWKRYNQRLQQEYEEEMERVERIRRMQSVFNRERDKYKKGYESWREHGPGAHQYYQQQRDDWYWKSDPSHRNQRTENNSRSIPRPGSTYAMSQHYAVLGLDRSRSKRYSDAEIKSAFRAKAMEYHPDQNQNNKEAAEAKFKEVMSSYEAIKLDRKNGNH